MKSDRRIIYLVSGPAHLPYLVASLVTLRQHWSGEIGVYVWPESYSLVQRIYEDDRLNITCVEQREPPYRKKDGVGSNSQFLHKIRVAQSLRDEVETVLYLDADTTIHGDLSPLFYWAEKHGFCATQWNDWVTTGKMVSGRIRGLLDVPGIERRWILRTVERSWPSVNGGVWASRPTCSVLGKWFDLTLKACPMFIADERVLHLMQTLYVPNGLMATLCERGRYNSCPKLNENLPIEDMIVRHYHGDSCCRPQKSQVGYDSWWPIYQRCLDENFGGIREWRGRIKNKHLNRIDGERWSS